MQDKGKLVSINDDEVQIVSRIEFMEDGEPVKSDYIVHKVDAQKDTLFKLSYVYKIP